MLHLSEQPLRKNQTTCDIPPLVITVLMGSRVNTLRESLEQDNAICIIAACCTNPIILCRPQTPLRAGCIQLSVPLMVSRILRKLCRNYKYIFDFQGHPAKVRWVRLL